MFQHFMRIFSFALVCDVPDFVEELGTSCRFTTQEGIELQVVVKGEPSSKPTILFLHGFPDAWLTWKKQIPFFVERGYRCAALSLRGYVESSKPEGVENYSIPKLISDVRDTIEFLGDQPVILVGNDWGGLIGFFLAVYYRNLVSKLILLNASFGSNFIRLQEQFLNSSARDFIVPPNLLETNIRMGNYALLETVFQFLTEDDIITRGEMNLRKCYSDIPGALTSITNYYRALFLFADENKDLDVDIKVPLKIIWGEIDRYVTLDNLDGVEEQIDDVIVVTYPDIGHFPHLEAADEVNEEILKFIN